MSDEMPKEIWASHKVWQAGYSHVNCTDVKRSERQVSYTRTDTIQAMQDKIDEQQRVIDRVLEMVKRKEKGHRDFARRHNDEKVNHGAANAYEVVRGVIEEELKALTQVQKEG